MPRCCLHVPGRQGGRLVRAGMTSSTSRSATSNRPMGLAVDAPTGSRSARRRQVWFLHAAHEFAGRAATRRTAQPCYLPASRTSPATSTFTTWPGLGRELVDRQHAVLLPVHARRPAQLRPALAAAVHLALGTRKTAATSTAWPSTTAEPQYVTALGADRRRRRLAAEQGRGGC